MPNPFRLPFTIPSSRLLFSSTILIASLVSTLSVQVISVNDWCAVLTADAEEISRLQIALSASRNILNHVNHSVQECENRHKLADLQRRLDTRHIDSLTDPVTVQYKVSSVL